MTETPVASDGPLDQAILECEILARQMREALIVDDDVDLCLTLKSVLSNTISDIQFAHTLESGKKMLPDFKPDVILADHTLPQFNSVEALEIMQQQPRHIPFILVTGTVSEEFAAEVIMNGADDYILKTNTKRLPQAIEKAVQHWKLEAERIQQQETENQNHRFLQSLINASPDIIYIQDIEDNRNVYSNDGIQLNLIS